MATEKQMVIKIVMKGDQLQAEVSKVTGSLKGIESQVGNLNKAFSMLKGVAVTALGGLGISASMEMIKMGASAKQAEQTFISMAKIAGESSDRIISAMEKATAGTIDSSDMMQKAIKGMALGMSSSDMVKIGEMARQTARITGESIGATFERITDAISTNMPRALKQMGLVTKEQMKIVEQAISAGVESVDLLTLAYANFLTQQAKIGKLQDNEAEAIQRLAAEWKDFKETIGNTMIGVILGLVHPIDTLTRSLKDQSDQLEENIDDMSRLAVAARNLGIGGEEGVSVWRGKIGEQPRETSEAQRYSRSILSQADIWTRNLKDQIAAIDAKKKADKEAEEAAKKAITFREKEIDLVYKVGAAQIESAGDREAIEARAYADWEKLEQKKIQKGYKDEEEAAKKIAEMQLKEQEKALEKQAKEWEHFWERVQDFTSDTLYDLFSGTIDSWSDMLTKMKNLFMRWIAEIASQQIRIYLQAQIGSYLTGGSGGGSFLSSLFNMGSSASGGSGTNWLSSLFSTGGSIQGGLTGAGTSGGMEALLGSSYSGAGTGGAAAGGASSLALGALPFAIGMMMRSWSHAKSAAKEGVDASWYEGAFRNSTYTPGQGLSGGTTREAFPFVSDASNTAKFWEGFQKDYGQTDEQIFQTYMADWRGPALQAYVDSRNALIDEFNKGLEAFVDKFPKEYQDVMEQLLARQDWNIDIDPGVWLTADIETKLQETMTALAKKYGETLENMFTEMGYTTEQVLALFETKSALTTSWDNFVMTLKTGDLAPVQSMETFSYYYQQLKNKAKANPNDASAMNAFMQYTSGTYLPFMKSYMGEGQDYASIFNQITSSSGDVYSTVFSGINKQFDTLFDYVKELLDRPINVKVVIGDAVLVDAIATAVDNGELPKTTFWGGA